MPTIIDELVLFLGWDRAQQQKIEKGHRAAGDALKKAKDKAAKQAEEIESSNTDAAETFAKITTEAALFFAALAAFEFAKDLIIKVNRSNSALGRFAKNVGMAPQEVASWSMAAERMGGSAEDAQSSVNSIAKAIFSLNTEGKRIPDEISRLSALSGVTIDLRHGVSKAMADISEAAQKLSRIDPAQTHFLLRGMGIAGSVGNAMIQYGRSTGDTARMLAPSNEAIAAAQDLTASFAGAQEAIRSLGSELAEQIDEPMAKLLDEMSTWIEANKDLDASNIVKWVEGVGERLAAIAKFAKARIDEFDAIYAYLKSSSPAGEVGAAIANRYGPQQQGSGEAVPIPWQQWWKSGEDFLKRHDPFDIGAHADELPPTDGKQVSAEPSGLTIAGQQASRGNPLPIDVVRVAGQGADANSLLGGPMGSGSPLPQTPQGGSGAPDSLRARGTPGGGGSEPNVTPQPDDSVQSLAAKYRDRYPHLSSQQCVALAMAAAGIGGTVRDWRRGDSVKDSALEPGTPIATFLNPDGTPSNRYAGGGIGTPGANRDHAAILLAKTADGIWVEEQSAGPGGPHAHFYPWKDPRGGEKSAENYFAINDSQGLPAGKNNPHRAPLHLPAHPHTLTPLPKTSALIPSGGAKMALAGYPVASSKTSTRNIGRLAVKGSSAQEIADNLVTGIRAELTA
jgi:hypothetical protein